MSVRDTTSRYAGRPNRCPWPCLATGLFVFAAGLAGACQPAAFAQATTPGAPPAPASPAPRDPNSNSLAQLADQFEKSPNTVVADVNGTPITLGMVADRVRELPAKLSILTPAAVYKGVLDDLVQQRALAVKAKDLGLDKDPTTLRRIQEATDREMAQAMTRRILPELVTGKAVKDQYEATVAGRPGQEEVQFRVIATATEAAANDALAALRNGTDFSKLAHEVSKDPSSLKGGEIGYARRDLLTPEIGAVTFALMPGQTTAYPVPSSGLWFVIQVEGRRQPGPPPLDAVREQIVGFLTRAATTEILHKSLAAVVVNDYGMTGMSGRDSSGAPKSR
jgi:peptidyl-prolyl cis-trans isomerase C